MTKKRRKGGRTTPKGTRPSHLRPVGDPRREESPVDEVIDTAARELLDEDDPLAAETWASGMLALFEGVRLRARLEGMEVPPFEEAVLQRCGQRGDREALIVAASLAAVLPAPHDRLARSTVERLRRRIPDEPAWVDTVGHVTATGAWVASDVFGDQESLIVAFAQDGAPEEHTLVALVDHNLSGQAKDVWIGTEPEEVVATWRSQPDDHMSVDELPASEALERLRDAMATADLWNGDVDLRSEEFANHRALVWARLRRAGLDDEPPASPNVSTDERDALVRDFLAAPEGRAVSSQEVEADVELLAEALVSLRSDYEGRPLRWSPMVVLDLLTNLIPRKVMLEADDAAAMPAVVRAFVRFAGGRTGLEPRFVEEILAAVDDGEREYLELIGDPAAAGPAKAVLSALQARGVDLTDVEAIKEALDVGGPTRLPTPMRPRRRSTAVAPTEVVAAAEQASILARITALREFYGEGRKLTQTGQPTLADARALVALLGTADRFDEKIGDHTFKTQSAAELLELSFTIQWAKTAGALRKEHGKLRATAAWGKLDGRALERWLKAADALPALGPLAGFFSNSRYRGRDEVLDELAGGILDQLRSGPQPFDSVLDWVCERADSDYEWLAPYMQDPEMRRQSFGWDLGRLSRIFAWAGIAERSDARVERDPALPGIEHAVGGTLELSLVGRWWLDEPG